MDNKEKIALIAQAINIDGGSLNLQTELEKLEEWDSMGKISLIAMINKKFDIILDVEEIMALRTVADILEKMK